MNQIIHDGRHAISATSWSFDYARLKLSSNATLDLDGGFELDTTDHYGSASSTDPPKTVAISAPLFRMDDTGGSIVEQFVSISDNGASTPGNYHFYQEGDHPGMPGFSGQAIVYPGTKTLYAMHIAFDKKIGKRLGIKISEYVSSQRSQLVDDAASSSLSESGSLSKLPESVLSTIDFSFFQRERLRRSGDDVKDVRKFFNELKQAEKSKREIKNIPESLLRYKDNIGSHQQQHMELSHKSGGSYFFGWLFSSVHAPGLIAMVNCMRMLVNEYFYRYLRVRAEGAGREEDKQKARKKARKTNLDTQRTANFAIKFPVDVGIDLAAGKKKQVGFSYMVYAMVSCLIYIQLCQNVFPSIHHGIGWISLILICC